MAEEQFAFPNRVGFGTDSAGMTLRDWFAGQAIGHIISATSSGNHMPVMLSGETRLEPAMARNAYAVADAMLAARGNS